MMPLRRRLEERRFDWEWWLVRIYQHEYNLGWYTDWWFTGHSRKLSRHARGVGEDRWRTREPRATVKNASVPNEIYDNESLGG